MPALILAKISYKTEDTSPSVLETIVQLQCLVPFLAGGAYRLEIIKPPLRIDKRHPRGIGLGQAHVLT